MHRFSSELDRFDVRIHKYIRVNRLIKAFAVMYYAHYCCSSCHLHCSYFWIVLKITLQSTYNIEWSLSAAKLRRTQICTRRTKITVSIDLCRLRNIPRPVWVIFIWKAVWLRNTPKKVMYFHTFTLREILLRRPSFALGLCPVNGPDSVSNSWNGERRSCGSRSAVDVIGIVMPQRGGQPKGNRQ